MNFSCSVTPVPSQLSVIIQFVIIHDVDGKKYLRMSCSQILAELKILNSKGFIFIDRFVVEWHLSEKSGTCFGQFNGKAHFSFNLTPKALTGYAEY